MAGSAGSLVVSLGLDAAEYTRGLTKAEYQARQFGEAIGTGIRNAAGLAAGALAALGLSAGGAVAGFNELIKSAGDFQDLAEITGASAEGLASFSVAAGTAGTTVEAIAQASVKLTKNLTGVDDESKAAGAAIAALGLNLNEFKALAPEAQIEAISKSLAGFADGAGKTAVATALLGKSGAELLPFLKALEEQGGRQVILTAEQIAQADEYGDKQAKLKAEIGAYAQVLAVQALPAMTAFTGAIADTASEILGLNGKATDLRNNSSVPEFAEAAVRALAFVVDAVDGVVRAFQVVGTTIGATAAAAASVASGDISAAKTIASEGIKDVQAILDRPLFSDKLNARLAAQKAAAASIGTSTSAPLKALKFDGAVPKGKSGANTAAQEAKAQLDADLAAIKNASSAITNTYSNQEKILEAQRSAGLKSEEVYYQEKARLIGLGVAAQEDALQKQIARLQQEKLSGKDQIDNLKKIANVEAELSKLREDASANSTVLSIKQADALEKIRAKFEAARQAAQAYVDAINNQNDRDLAGMGRGNNQREQDARLASREDEARRNRDALLGQLTSGEISQKDYDTYLGIQDAAHAKALASDSAYWTKKRELQGNFLLGAQEGLTNYYEESQNVYDQIAQVGSNAFKGLEDALVEFTRSGKLNFKSLADSIMADLARVAIKQSITGPLANLLSGAFGGSSGGSSDVLGAFISGLGGRASGGNLGPRGLVEVNENGPELFDYRGKQYLLNGNANGSVTPNHQIGGGGGYTQNIQYVVQGKIDRSTQDQAANKIRRQTQTAAARFG